MPRGIFLLVHDEIKGPEIKCSFFKIPINLPQEFISKLYISHAGFETSSSLEMKFGQYRIFSCFTGHVARRTQKEGILGLVLEEEESIDNLELFLKRNLEHILNNPTNETIKEIFSVKLMNYNHLNDLFEKIKIQNLPELFIISGDREYKTSIIRIGEKKTSNVELAHFFHKIIENRELPQYKYFELDIEDKDSYFIIIKQEKANRDVIKIISTMKPFLEHFFLYSLEILALFLAPTQISVFSLNSQLKKKFAFGKRSIIDYLNESQNYGKEFNDILSFLIKGQIYISPIEATLA